MSYRNAARALAGAALVVTLAHAGPARAQEPPAELRFELRVTPPTGGTLRLSQFPSLQIAVTPARSTGPDVGAQLAEAIARASSARGAPGFETSFLFGDFTVTARTEPRAENEPLVVPFEAALARCLRAVDPAHQDELDSLWVVLRGGGASSATAAEARAAGRFMAEAFTADGCARARNTYPLEPLTRESMTVAVRGLLTETWDRRYFFGDREIRRVIDVLSPLFFGATGIWVDDRRRAAREVLVQAIDGGLLSEATYAALLAARFETFVDAVTYARRAQPGVTVSALEVVARACLPDDEDALYEPFSLRACVARGALTPYRVRLGESSGVALERRSP